MCDSCCLDPQALEELLAEQARDDDEPFDLHDSKAEEVRFTDPKAALHEIDHSRPIWVSAGPTITATLNDPDAPPIPAPDLLLRDALGQLGRAFFDRKTPRPIILEWHPAIAPVLLDAAARFGDGRGPLVWTVLSHASAQNALHAAQAADWRRGALVSIPPQWTMSPRALIAGRALRAAVFLGGDDQSVGADARALPRGAAPVFAVGSTGGTARSLFATDSTYGSQNPALAPRLTAPGSYLELFNELAGLFP